MGGRIWILNGGEATLGPKGGLGPPKIFGKNLVDI